MSTPRTEELPAALRLAAREIARRLGAAGHRVWVVGGAVRDLAAGREPTDLDVASAATPEEVEALFSSTHAVGRAFGTLLIPIGGDSVQHTTFRSETGYSDARHPDAVAFGSTLEEDAARRDFTCNALYLDPLNDDVRDPEGGLADVEGHRLRCVGEPASRFAEDGLRLVRLARFHAVLGWEVEAETRRAAGRSGAALSGLSAERVRTELERMAVEGDARRGLGLLEELGLLWAALPGLDAEAPGRAAAWEVLRALGPRPGLVPALAALYGAAEHPEGALVELRPSRALARDVRGAWRAAEAFEALVGEEPDGAPRRAGRLRAWREDGGPAGLALAAARARAVGQDAAPFAEIEAFCAARAPEELRPRPLLGADDLAAAGVPRGPAWGRLLAALETEQLEGRLADREAALAWLRGREDAP